MKFTQLLCGALVFLAASTCLASEGDVLIDLGGSAAFVGGGGRKQPSLDIQGGAYYGINDMTDLGVFYRADIAQPKSGPGDSVIMHAGGISSWLTTYEGGIRPQVGGQLGFAHAHSNSFLYAALAARALIELQTHIRIFVGATGGGYFGHDGAGFISADLGLQLLF
jgi:hypothetical protein